MEARFSAPVQTGPGAHPASRTVGTGSFPGVKSGRCVTLTTHPLLVPWSRKSSAIPLLPLWAVRPVQSLSACTRVTLPYLSCIRQTCSYNAIDIIRNSVNLHTRTHARTHAGTQLECYWKHLLLHFGHEI